MSATTVYSFDTSALIDGLERFYPEEQFETLWQRVDELVEAGRFVVSEEAWEEARVKDAAVKTWCEARKKESMVVATDSKVAAEVKNILAAYPNLVKAMKNRNRADAFVIAVGSIRGATVVTGEGSDGTQSKPKIPFVCAGRGVPCIRFLDVIRGEGWKF
jgi:O-methyltransferase involved in polyketide biosynthesis